MPVFREIPASKTGHVPVKIWTDDIEASAEQQLTALASCPFVVGHVAAMPDVHYGLGATIGSVFATSNELLPTAVGVDIGCFTGDTSVPLVDGTSKTLRELTELGGEHWVWAITPTQHITAARATAKRTREQAALFAVTLDNGQTIRCTPDHEFMLRDGSWLPAQQLQPGASLMPLYHKVDHDGAVLIQQPATGQWQRTGATSGATLAASVARCAAEIGAAPVNHKVVAVAPLAEREDVYCLTVPGYGNFALSAGVFVHNCGMLAQPFNVRAVDLSQAFLRELHTLTKRVIPTGFGAHPDPQAWSGFDEGNYTAAVAPIVQDRAAYQLGSLGGGNHFLELCQDEDGLVWLMLHSGSRGAGNCIAQHHIEIARELNQRLKIKSAPDLWVLPLDTAEGQAYLKDMLWSQDYAMENRQRMRWSFTEAFGNLLSKRLRIDLKFNPDDCINIHHNYAHQETALGRQLWVHRKGATFAGKDVLGIIPGSMATGSYIVRGLGNPELLQSCSHGAGRVLSRGAALRSITLEAFAHKMQGIVAETTKEYLDEAPQAYKDLDTVIHNQSDLIAPVRRLRPIMNVKGAGKAGKDRSRDKDDAVQRRKSEQRKRKKG